MQSSPGFTLHPDQAGQGQLGGHRHHLLRESYTMEGFFFVPFKFT
jgi:hypothetical protein